MIESAGRRIRRFRQRLGLLGSLPRPWQGVYRDFSEVPGAGDGFAGEDWVPLLADSTRNLVHAAAQGRLTREWATGDHQMLSLLAAVACRESGGVRILDFGGGMGAAYVFVASQVPDCPALEYHVIEVPEVCDEGRRLFERDDRIRFHATPPDAPGRIDIVYISSALQYAEDYAGTIKRLADYGARFFLYSKLQAGDVPTFATGQTNVGSSVIPYWFVNIAEILDVMRDSHYRLIFDERCAFDYDQANLPKEYRLDRCRNLLFESTNAGRA